MQLPRPFDGFDWDLEGNDYPNSVWNHFTPATLDIVVDMSAKAKENGYIVTMAPAQSYLDTTTNNFSLSLTHSYPDYHPDFHYRGQNCYAYILAAAPSGTFDFIVIQLYEGWSRASQAVQEGEEPSRYLKRSAAAYTSGWTVDFGNNPDLRVRGSVKIT